MYNKKKEKKISHAEFNKKLKAYFKSSLLKDYLLIIFASFLSMISYDYFIASTTNNGITPSGIGAIVRGIVIYIWNNDLTMQNSMYWIIYFIINIPLFIFGVLKIGFRFSLRTIIYIIFQNGFHFIFAYIPFINPTEFHFILNYKDLILYQNSNLMYQIWLFIFAIIAGILNGISFGLLYKGGSSSGGTDFILAYFSIKRKISIANYNRIVNYFIVLIMISIHILLIKNENLTKIFFGLNWKKNYLNIINDNNYLNKNNFNHNIGLINNAFIIYKIKYFFGPVLFATYSYIIVQSIITDIIFPKFKYRSLMIITNKANEIITGLKYIKYTNDLIRIEIKNILFNNNEDNNNKNKENLNNNNKINNNNNNLIKIENINEIKGEMLICPTSLLEYKNVKAAIIVSDSKAKILSYKLDKIIGNFIISKY